MIGELTALHVFVSILGYLHGYFFLVLTIFLAQPLTELACKSVGLRIAGVSGRITLAMAMVFLITVFFSLSLSWVSLFAAGDTEAVKEYFRPWALFWFLGILSYAVVVRVGRSRGE